MRKAIPILLIALGTSGFSLQAHAKGPGGSLHGPTSPSMPAQATSNANAPWTGTQEKGLDRAQERMSDQGLLHEKATDQQDRRDSKPQNRGTLR